MNRHGIRSGLHPQAGILGNGPRTCSLVSFRGGNQYVSKSTCPKLVGGGAGIRTLGGVNLAGFQDQCFRPLSHPSLNTQETTIVPGPPGPTKFLSQPLCNERPGQPVSNVVNNSVGSYSSPRSVVGTLRNASCATARISTSYDLFVGHSFNSMSLGKLSCRVSATGSHTSTFLNALRNSRTSSIDLLLRVSGQFSL